MADVYRDLGMLARAREVNAEVAERASGDARQQALISLAVMSDTLDDSERWYRQADPEHPFVKHSLLQIEADRLAAKGAYAEADEKYAQVFEWQVRGAEIDATAANNAALTLTQRYGCTGDIGQVDRAVELMAGGVRLNPGSALIVGNYADLITRRGYLRVLDRWLDLRALRLDSSDASTVIAAMLDGPDREGLLAALQQSNDLRQGREHARQQELLGPHRPDGYSKELGWYLWWQDVARLRDLKGRLESAGGIDTSRLARNLEVWEGGEKDADFRDDWQGQLESIRARRTALPAGTSPSTRAVSWLLEAQIEDRLLAIDGGLARARAVAEAYRQARAVWPSIGAARDLAGALVQVALFEAAETESDLAQAWLESHRRLGIDLILNDLMDRQAASIDALRTRPELAEAVALVLPIAARRPAFQDHVLGRLTGSHELAAAGRRVFDSELKRLEAELQMLLTGSESSAAYLALFKNNA